MNKGENTRTTRWSGIFVEQLLIRGENARAIDIFLSREGFPKKRGEKKKRKRKFFTSPTILDQTLSNVLKQSNNYN